jgi:hypothetical protein
MAHAHMEMTTIHLIDPGGKERESATSSARGALNTSTLRTPQPEPMEVDDAVPGPSNSRSREDGQGLPSKRPKLSLSILYPRVIYDRIEEWHRQQQETIRELSNVRGEQGVSLHYLITPTDRILTS